MRILNCVPVLENLNGGPTVCISNLLDLMNENNFNVDLLIGSNKVEKNFLLSKKYRTFTLGNNFLIKLIRLFKIINKYDIVHIHSFWTIFILKVILVSFLLRKKIILTPHGMLTETSCSVRKIKSYLVPFVNLIIKKISLFHFLTRREYKDTIKYLKVKNLDRFIIQANWIKTKDISINQTKKLFENNKFNIVFLGRVHPVKNILLQVELIYKLKLNNINAKLFIIGPKFDKDYYRFLKQKIDHFNINNMITFLGPIYDDNKFNYLAGADACLMTSKFECNSIAALEIMQAGGILIATKQCSLSDANKYGAIKEVNPNLNDLFKSIFDLIKDKNKGFIIRRKAKLFVEEFHSSESALKSFRKIYNI